MKLRAQTSRNLILALPLAFAVSIAASGPLLEGRQLTAALQRDGHVILMRHANSPGITPDPGQIVKIQIWPSLASAPDLNKRSQIAPG
jgi:hypothetical protein